MTDREALKEWINEQIEEAKREIAEFEPQICSCHSCGYERAMLGQTEGRKSAYEEILKRLP